MLYSLTKYLEQRWYIILAKFSPDIQMYQNWHWSPFDALCPNRIECSIYWHVIFSRSVFKCIIINISIYWDVSMCPVVERKPKYLWVRLCHNLYQMQWNFVCGFIFSKTIYETKKKRLYMRPTFSFDMYLFFESIILSNQAYIEQWW